MCSVCTGEQCAVCVQVLPRGSFANYLLTLPTGWRPSGEGREEMMERGRWRKRVLANALHIVFSVGIVIAIGVGIGSCFFPVAY